MPGDYNSQKNDSFVSFSFSFAFVGNFMMMMTMTGGSGITRGLDYCGRDES